MGNFSKNTKQSVKMVKDNENRDEPERHIDSTVGDLDLWRILGFCIVDRLRSEVECELGSYSRLRCFQSAPSKFPNLNSVSF